jgi:hypothetical protein
MLTTFLLYLVFSVYDIVGPLYQLRSATNVEMKKLKKLGLLAKDAQSLEYSFLELQSKMWTYDGALQNDDYIQILLPLAFVIVFGITFPVGSALALMCFGLQLRVDAWKLVFAMRRAYPNFIYPGQWVWQSIIEQFMQIAVVTNLGMMCFTMKPVSTWPIHSKWLLFFALWNISFMFGWAIQWLLPEVSDEVHLARRRHVHQREAAMQYRKDGKDSMRVMDTSDLVVELQGITSRSFRSLPKLDKLYEGGVYETCW